MKPQKSTFTACASASALLSCFLLAGCSTGGKLTVRSNNNPKATASGQFDQGIYRVEDKTGMTAVLIDGPVDNPARIMTIRTLWPPRNARTPLDPDATNATIRYIVFDGDQVGVYGGAGFVYPKGKVGRGSVHVVVEQSNLRLTDASPNFRDPIGAASAKGGFTVRRADGEINESLRKLSLRVSDALGYPQFVRAHEFR